MPIQIGAHRVNTTATASTQGTTPSIAARFSHFVGKISSSISSLGHRMRPAPRPLQNRHVCAEATVPVARQLHAAISEAHATPLSQGLLSDLRAGKTLRKQDAGRAQEAARNADALFEARVISLKDSSKLAETHLPDAPIQDLEEPGLELTPENRKEYKLDTESLAPIANRMENLFAQRAKLAGDYDRKPTSELGEALTNIDQEIKQLGKTVGERANKALNLDSPDSQNRYAAFTGFKIKGQVWAMLREANPNLPDWSGSDIRSKNLPDESPAKLFLDHAHYEAGKKEGIGFEPWNGSLDNLPDLNLNGSKFTPVKKLGQGGGGAVFLYQNGATPPQQVAIKLPLTSSANAQRAAHQEAESHMLAMGAQGEGHANVLGLKGVALISPDMPVVILECASHGDMRSLVSEDLKNNDGHVSGQHLGSIDRNEAAGRISPRAAQLVRLLAFRDSLQGAQFLQESRGLFHSDYKPENVFIGTDGKAKIADFGTSASTDVNPETAQVVGTHQYQAPETAQDAKPLTRKTDTWALGVFGHELFNKGKRPDASYSRYSDRVRIEESAAAQPSATGVTRMEHLLNAMTHPDPTKRPTLSAALESGIFGDLNAGGEALETDVRNLMVELTKSPPDTGKLMELSDKIGA